MNNFCSGCALTLTLCCAANNAVKAGEQVVFMGPPAYIYLDRNPNNNCSIMDGDIFSVEKMGKYYAKVVLLDRADKNNNNPSLCKLNTVGVMDIEWLNSVLEKTKKNLEIDSLLAN
jgi:hypothetical protein